MKAIKPKDRKALNSFLYDFTKNRYFDDIPLLPVWEKLKEHNLIPLQEDNTEWQGLLVGEQAQVLFSLGYIDTKKGANTYDLAKNVLVLSWYKMPSGRYELVAYIS